jgi:hypothetical protein
LVSVVKDFKSGIQLRKKYKEKGFESGSCYVDEK